MQEAEDQEELPKVQAGSRANHHREHLGYDQFGSQDQFLTKYFKLETCFPILSDHPSPLQECLELPQLPTSTTSARGAWGTAGVE